MPIYEYRCAECGVSFEALVGANFPKAACPRCSSGNLSREMSVFSSAKAAGEGPGAAPSSPSGGCCGGGCGCATR